MNFHSLMLLKVSISELNRFVRINTVTIMKGGVIILHQDLYLGFFSSFKKYFEIHDSYQRHVL